MKFIFVRIGFPIWISVSLDNMVALATRSKMKVEKHTAFFAMTAL